MRWRLRSSSRAFLALVFGVVLVAGLPGPALANPLRIGADFFTTLPGGTWQKFNLPSGLFGDGSDPVVNQQINFQGVPIRQQCGPGGGQAMPDTAVQRLERAHFPHDAPTDTIMTELVHLSLASVQPLTVTFNGGQTPSFWHVGIFLSTVVPQPPSSMTIVHDTKGGGTFTSTLMVQPRFVFTEVGGPGTVDFDTGTAGLPPVSLESGPTPWTHREPEGVEIFNPSRTNFVPGSDGTGLIPTEHIQSGFDPQTAHAVVAAECQP